MLKITPKACAAAYEYLRATNPFTAWKLPHSDGVRFEVVQRDDVYGEFEMVEGVPTIRMSEKLIGHTVSLMASMAHEMYHLYQERKGDREVHGPRYKRAAKRICAAHGFDLKMF
jgi:hypothetical protein